MVNGYQLWCIHYTRIMPECNKSLWHTCLCSTCLSSYACVHGFSVITESTVCALGTGFRTIGLKRRSLRNHPRRSSLPSASLVIGKRWKEQRAPTCLDVFFRVQVQEGSQTAWRIIRFSRLIIHSQLCIEHLHVSVSGSMWKENWTHSPHLPKTYSSCGEKRKILSPAYVYWTPTLG